MTRTRAAVEPPRAPAMRRPKARRPSGPIAPVETLESRTLLAAVPTGFADTSNWVSNLGTTATSMSFAPDGRLFVTQQTGQLRVVKNGALLTTPFLSRAVDSTGERGLLGVAFDPAFASNGFVYVYYTVPGAPGSPVHNRISRFTASAANPDVAAAGSEVIVMELDPLSGATNHNGGAIHFGPDGKLYAAVGENANPSNSQTLANRHGKMLRINADGTIPTDNPFYNTATGANRAIWALGLRNPFTFAFQPGTGRMFINDVGDNGPDLEKWEEINEGRAGANYGWPTTGDGYFNAAQFPQFTNPVYAYNHTQGGRVITGGAFYNPPVQNFPSSYLGDYFFADYSGSFIRKLEAPITGGGRPPSQGGLNFTPFATGAGGPVDLQVGPDGYLYYLSRSTGNVGRIRYTANLAPVIGTQPANATVARGEPATFSVGASGDGTLNYQWQRLAPATMTFVDIPGATAATYTLQSAAEADNGARFRVVVTNNFGSATSNEAVLTVVPNDPPVGTITAPVEGATFAAGETINFSGTATDAQDGALPASAFTWEVYYYTSLNNGTGGVRRPYATFPGVTSGSFTAADVGPYTNADVLYRIELVVQDSGGLTGRAVRDVLPRTSSVTLDSSVPGLSLNLDGQPQAAPYTFVGVEGFRRSLEAPQRQTVGGTTYEFVSWSDGGARLHEIATPVDDTTYTAVYRAVTPGLRVEARRVFYNNSAFDGFNPAANAADDGAVATDKQALLPGQASTFTNVTGYSRGINGIMLDVFSGLDPTPPVVTAANFQFQTSRNGLTWEAGPAPREVTVRGMPIDFFRITVTFDDGAVANEWLRVTFFPSPDVPVGGPGGPLNADVSYFGNLAGETGDPPTGDPAALRVSALDLAATRQNMYTPEPGIENRYDHNRDRRVNALDLAVVRRNLGRQVELFTAPPPPVAPIPGAAALPPVWQEESDDPLA